MTKRSVNLILPIKPEPPFLKKLRVFLPIIAGIMIFIFVVVFGITLVFLKIQSGEYEKMRAESQELETKISSQKSEEGLYLITYRMISAIEKIISKSTTFNGFVTEVSAFNTNQMNLTEFSIDSEGSVKITVMAQDADSLTNLIHILSKAEENKQFTDITASDIVRNADGAYHISLTFDPNPELLK